MARLYYKKPSFIMHGFVVASGLQEEGVEPLALRRFNLNRTLFEIIEGAIMDPDMENMPTDLVSGREFKIVKTKKGDFANYSTSAFGMRERALSAEELAVVNAGLPKLSDYLGRRPDTDEIAMMGEMLKDSLDGKPFDTVAYGGLYRAYTRSGQGSSLKAPEVQTPTSDDSTTRAREVLAEISARNQTRTS